MSESQATTDETAHLNVKTGKDGKPFTSDARAETELRKIGLDEDVWGVCRYDGGYVIAKHKWIAHRRVEEHEAAETRARKANAKPETYHWVVIAGGGDPNDYVNVPVNCNGEFPGMLWIQRNKRVPLPSRLINVLMDAHHGNYRPMTGGTVPCRKEGDIWLFPVTVHEEATEKDWEGFFEHGRREREAVITAHQTQEKG